ncbi:hypothetical protein Cadr_000030823 [Camelus dromedarius]|uniref:Uncharacterized protein n=1 Tax=Camelus dromedarius TaxID=9838 RepID=A0A5N4BZD7_CAMDR|nr:hypothetical protein Cadr_000030823 [Camelus dromedarius]
MAVPSTPTHSACATCSHPSLLRESLAGVWFQVRKPCWVEMHTFRSTAVASARSGDPDGPNPLTLGSSVLSCQGRRQLLAREERLRNICRRPFWSPFPPSSVSSVAASAGGASVVQSWAKDGLEPWASEARDGGVLPGWVLAEWLGH